MSRTKESYLYLHKFSDNDIEFTAQIIYVMIMTVTNSKSGQIPWTCDGSVVSWFMYVKSIAELLQQFLWL